LNIFENGAWEKSVRGDGLGERHGIETTDAEITRARGCQRDKSGGVTSSEAISKTFTVICRTGSKSIGGQDHRAYCFVSRGQELG